MAYSTIDTLISLLEERRLAQLADDFGATVIKRSTFTADGSGAGTVSCSSASWATNHWAGCSLIETDVDGNETVYEVLSNTDTELTLDTAEDIGAGQFDLKSRAALVCEKAIADADSEIDFHVRKRYALPLSSVPKVVENLSGTIAVWFLYTRRSVDDSAWEKRYARAMQTLERVALGRFELFDEERDGVDDYKPATVTWAGPQQTFKNMRF